MFYIIKEIVQPKVSLNSRKFLIWKKRERGKTEPGVGTWAGQQADLF
jgi:hypothetical protein